MQEIVVSQTSFRAWERKMVDLEDSAHVGKDFTAKCYVYSALEKSRKTTLAFTV